MTHETAPLTGNVLPETMGRVEKMAQPEAVQLARNTLPAEMAVDDVTVLKLSGEKAGARVDETSELLGENDVYLRIGTEDQEQLFTLIHINELLPRLKQGESIKIGRSQDATIRLDSSLVSANHAEIRYDVENELVMIGVIATNESLLLQVPKANKNDEPSKESTPRTEVLEEVGSVATNEVIEVAEEIKKPSLTEAQKHEKQLQVDMMFDVHTLRNIAHQGDLHYFSQYLTSFERRIGEFRAAHPNLTSEAANLDGAVQTMRVQISVDMQNGQFSRLSYEDILNNIEVLIMSH